MTSTNDIERLHPIKWAWYVTIESIVCASETMRGIVVGDFPHKHTMLGLQLHRRRGQGQRVGGADASSEVEGGAREYSNIFDHAEAVGS